MKQSYSVDSCSGAGKTTMHEQLIKECPDLLPVEDGARIHFSPFRKPVEELTKQQLKDGQMNTIAYYLGSHIVADRRGQGMLLDGSFITVRPYAERYLPDTALKTIDKVLGTYKDRLLAFIIPPTIPLVDDGVRHIDNDFRLKIYQEIVQTVNEFEIPHIYILSQNVQDRVKEALSYIK